MKARLRLVLGVVLALLMAGCGRTSNLASFRTTSDLVRAKGAPGADEPFPPGFLWGVSTAGYQYEGNDTTSNWAQWEKDGHVSQKSGVAIDDYHRYEEDLDLAKSMHMGAYRMSLEWSRLEPQRGVFDPQAIAHYHAVIEAALKRGLTPIVTLNHFTYPEWLDHPISGGAGGWESPETLVEFQRYATWAAKEYAPEVRTWITLNEPNTLAINGYLLGVFPPGKHDPFAYSAVLGRMMQAHRLAYAALHAARPDVRVSLNPFVFEGRSGGANYTTQGFDPDDQALLDAAMGYGQASTSPTLDYIAFDYYYPLSPGDVPDLLHAWTWSVYPEGMYKACRQLYGRYKLPLLVAENGMATDGDLPRADGWSRSAFLVNHLAQLRRAMAEGIPVMGYMHWSLVDNYEWGSFNPRFGLFAIDRRDPTLTRIRTDAVDTYQAIASANALPGPLLARYLGHRN